MNPTQYPAYLARETAFVAALSPGAKGIAVRRVQEWLSHHGFQTVIDADYGPRLPAVPGRAWLAGHRAG